MEATLNKLLPADEDKIISDLIGITGTFSCMATQSEIMGFFKNPSNRAAIISAYNKYGMPPANREAVRHFLRWEDFCDWDRGILKFYCAAKLYASYPEMPMEQINCSRIKTVVNYLEQEKLNADKEGLSNRAAADVKMAAINDFQTEYVSAYSSLDCENYLTTQEQLQLKAQLDSAASAAAVTSRKATPTTYFVYGIAGVIIFLGIRMLVKK